MDRWNRFFYVLQDEEGEPGKGGASDPPADPPKGDDPPAPVRTLPVDILPEDLRDRPDAEVRFLLKGLVDTLGHRNNQVEQLKDQIAELRGSVARSEPPPPPDPNDDKPLEELILEDADAAIERWMKAKGYLDAFENLASRVDETEFDVVARQIDGFEEVRDDVNKMLRASNLPATKRNILGAYKMVLGERALEARSRGTRTSSVPPSPPEPPTPPGPKDDEWASELEREMARAHGVTSPKDWRREDITQPMKLKLPT